MRAHVLLLVAIVTLTAILAAGCMIPSPPSQNLSGATPTVTQAPVCRTATSAEEMVAFVEKAYEFAKVEGKEAALAEFNNRSGRFVDGDLVHLCLRYQRQHAGPPLPAAARSARTGGT